MSLSCVARPCPRKKYPVPSMDPRQNACLPRCEENDLSMQNHSQDAKRAMSASNGERGLVMMDELQRRLRSRQVNRRSPALVGDLEVCLTNSPEEPQGSAQYFHVGLKLVDMSDHFAPVGRQWNTPAYKVHTFCA